MATPRSAIANALIPTKGYDIEHALTIDLPFDSEFEDGRDAAGDYPRGIACHIHPGGEFKVRPGVHHTAMTLFNFTHTDDPDVKLSRTNPATDSRAWVGSGSGNCVFIVATCGMELETTEFDPEGDYDSDTRLTAPLTTADAGRLEPVTLSTDDNYASAFCGVVSTGVKPSPYHATPSAYVPAGATQTVKEVLAFWPVYQARSYAP